jgi:putative membrane-bound dehydrogenase-like protein
VSWRLLALLCALIVPTTLSADDAPSLADELKSLPPVEPADVMQTFAIQKGFSLELVAHEPDVVDPVDACFDENGRLYVAEMRGYPYSEEPREMQPKPLGKKNACRVRLLEDTDQDGRFDKSTIFADGMSWVVSVCCSNGGVYVLAPDKLYYFKDTTGDGVADERRVVIEGFSRYNVQGLANNMKWGLDNRITASGGTSASKLQHGAETLGELSHRDWSLNPKTDALTRVTGGQQYGHSYDDWGNRFVCNNSNHIQHVVIPQEALDRDGAAFSSPIRSVAVEGAAAVVYRTSPPEPWRIVRTRRRAADPSYRSRLPATELVATGFFTSATGVTIFRGDSYPEEFHGNAFIGDVGGNLIHRKTVSEQGVSFTAKRADDGVEFITSTDTWFRPVNFVNGPDGCLYVLDMYRETIEHPSSIPEDMKEHLHLESGDDRGRIYRLIPPGWKPRPFPKLGGLSAAELVTHLDAPSSWERETAQRLLWEREDKSVEPALRTLLNAAKRPVGVVHALWLLDGLNLLKAEDLTAAFRHADPHVREHAVRLATKHLDSMPSLGPSLVAFQTESAPRVQFALAYALGLIKSPEAISAMNAIGVQPDLNADVLAMLSSSIGDRAEGLLDALLASTENDSEWRRTLIRRAASTEPGAIRVLDRAMKFTNPEARIAVVAALGRQFAGEEVSVDEIARSKLMPEESGKQILAILKEVERAVLDPDEKLELRLKAVPVTQAMNGGWFEHLLSQLLEPQTPPELQSAMLKVAADIRWDLSPVVLNSWSQLAPARRAEAVAALLRHADRTASLLQAIKDGKLSAAEIDPTARQVLLSHPNEKLRTAAVALFGVPNADRQKVIETYRPALELAGDASRGLTAFKKHCAACHRVDQDGANVGPQFTSVTNKSPEDLLIAIMDPNREAQAIYQSYTVVTDAGRVVSGLIAGDTAAAVTLRQAEGKEETIPRTEIDAFKANGVSLMPVGLEKTVAPQEIADLIAFIKSLAVSAP